MRGALLASSLLLGCAHHSLDHAPRYSACTRAFRTELEAASRRCPQFGRVVSATCDESGCRARFDHGRERNVFTLLVACGLGPEFIQPGVTTNQSGPADTSSPMDPEWSLTVPRYCDESA